MKGTVRQVGYLLELLFTCPENLRTYIKFSEIKLAQFAGQIYVEIFSKALVQLSHRVIRLSLLSLEILRKYYIPLKPDFLLHPANRSNSLKYC
jgi:hypothetical protein